MSKTLKLLLGLVTLWPFAYLILFFALIFSMFLFMAGSGPGSGPPQAIALIFPVHLLTMLIVMALMVFYIVDVFRNNQVEKDKKVLWAVVLFMGNMIAMPVYWYLYIWKATPATVAPAPSQLGSADTTAWTSDVRTSRSEEQAQYVPPTSPPNWRE